MLTGREKEQQMLITTTKESDSQFIVIYGRRRVGKTYLIRETFNKKFIFEHAGLANESTSTQINAFAKSLKRAGLKTKKEINNWLDAFECLKDLIEHSHDKKKIIFIDELSWMDTQKSGFLSALENFWNGWASGRKDIVFIVCASATSWMLNKIIHNKGGLYNRLSMQIHLKPFKLADCEEYLKSKKILLNRYEILELYMIFGGIPYYWTFVKKGLSLAQNIDAMLFYEDAPLKDEFKYLYASLFKNPQNHIEIVTTLAKKKVGMTREELSKKSGISNSGNLTKLLQELSACDFIREYSPFGKEKKETIYQLMDNYTLFYFKFLEKKKSDEHFWTNQIDTPLRNAWCGISFERVCLEHIQEIKQKLGILGVQTEVHSWYRKADKKNDTSGTQIDLLIARKDQVINICEMKFCTTEFAVTKKDDESMRNKLSTFKTHTKTRYSLHPTLITTYGIKDTLYSGMIQSVITLNDLFSKF